MLHELFTKLNSGIGISSYDFNWRLAFWASTVIALVGFVARTKLREAPEFFDAQYRIKRVFERINIDTAILKAALSKKLCKFQNRLYIKI